MRPRTPNNTRLITTQSRGGKRPFASIHVTILKTQGILVEEDAIERAEVRDRIDTVLREWSRHD